jgi:sodium-dependent dicarboxylate transporter 2/3/5
MSGDTRRMEELFTTISPRKLFLSVAAAALMFLIPTGESFTAQIRLTSAVGLLMALLWLTEAVPIGLTALLPLIIFPLAGIQTAEKTAAPYANPAVFLFLGGFLVAATVERWNLHRRIAYGALSIIGTNPPRILLAVLVTTAILSMWMSNTATTLMMTPIAVAIVRSLGASGSWSDVSSPTSAHRLAESALLAVAYGASLGGIGTPIGTPTNLIFFGAAKQLFPDEKTISFAQWMGFGIVFLLLALPLCWLILLIHGGVRGGKAIPIDQLGLERPGSFSRGEKLTVLLCAATAFLWVFRADIDLGSVVLPGWSRLFPNPKAIHDATIAVAMAFVAFIVPVGKGERLLPWSEFKKVPWDVLVLFGGGFALAEALEASGFSKWAGANLSFVGSWPPWLMIAALCVAVTLLSEVASNVATATTMMPIAAALAMTIGVHPFALMLPAVLAASSGFMLPVATAPNTIVYATGLVRVRSMSRAGFALDLAATLIITLLMFAVVPRVIGIPLFR